MLQVFCVSFLQQSAGPSKKGKPTSAAGGKSKKTPDSKEVTESELSVSLSDEACGKRYVQYKPEYKTIPVSFPTPVFQLFEDEKQLIRLP